MSASPLPRRGGGEGERGVVRLLTRKRETSKLERMMAFSAVFAASERGHDGRYRQNGGQNRNPREILGVNMNRTPKMNPIRGDSRESNSGPLAPEARIIPLDHYPNDGNMGDSLVLVLYVFCPTPHNPLYRTPRALTALRSPLSTAHLLPPLPDPLIARRTHSHPL